MGWDELEISAQNITINYNDGSEWFGALGPPVIDFANTPVFADERIALFDEDDSGGITVGDLRTLQGLASGTQGTGAFATLYASTDDDARSISIDDIVALLDSNSVNGGNDDGQLDVSEAETVLADMSLTGNEDADGDDVLDPVGFEVGTGDSTAPVYIDFDGNQRIGFSSENITLQLSEFVHVTGSFAFEKGPVLNATVATGLPSDGLSLLQDLGNAIEPGLGDTLRDFGTTIPDVEVATFQVGAANVHAFVGLDGPYWEGDADGDGNVDNEGPTEDLDGDGVMGEDEVNEQAIGLVIDQLDLGFVTMEPTVGAFAELLGIDDDALVGIIPKFSALKATASSVELVGLDEVVLSAEDITINYNNGTEWFGQLGPPVIDFQNTPRFADERIALFDEDESGAITVGDLRTLQGLASDTDGTGAFAALYTSSDPDGTSVTIEEIVALLDDSANGGDDDGQLDVGEAESVLSDVSLAAANDVDTDGVLDPLGFEVGTGDATDPVYIDFDGNQRIGAVVREGHHPDL